MSNTNTAISWTDKSWNPVTGCSRVSPGCENCYAEALSLRFGRSKLPWTARNAAENVVLHPERLGEPLTWRKPARVFVNSMSDLFHEQIPIEFVGRVLNVIGAARQHTFQVLTKRPERMRATLSTYYDVLGRDPLSNLWVGVSVEDQRRAVERIPVLLETPAVVRFLSCEPLLSGVNLRPWLPRLDWVIAGGESGPGYRPMDLEWARSLRDQCGDAGVAYWFKQSSARFPGKGDTLDGVTHHEFPAMEVPA